MAALGEARLREMEALQALRLANEGKLLSPVPDAETRVCVCQRAPAAPMIQCELCRDAFHTGCVTVAPGVAQGPPVWLCPHCRRSEKPPLEKILPLLASLQRIRVRLPEGDALRYMIERTVSWQHRAQHLLSSGSLTPVQDRVGSGPSLSRWPASAGQASETSKVSRSPRCQLPGVGCTLPLSPCWASALVLLVLVGDGSRCLSPGAPPPRALRLPWGFGLLAPGGQGLSPSHSVSGAGFTFSCAHSFSISVYEARCVFNIYSSLSFVLIFSLFFSCR